MYSFDQYLSDFARPIRAFARHVASSNLFDQTILVCIIMSSVCLALDSPRLDPASELAHWLSLLNLVFTLIFTCEAAIKISAYGLWEEQNAYLRSAWNQLDLVLVCISLLILFSESVPWLHSLRVLRVLRVLRPLRLVSRNAGMKLIITSLFKATPQVSNVFGVIVSLQVVFSILGMQIFAGCMASCSDPTIHTEAECVGFALPPSPPSWQQSEYLPELLEQAGYGTITAAPAPPQHQNLRFERRWQNPAIGSFDDFGSSMRLLYIMSTSDQWENGLYAIMGATTPGSAPVRDDFSPRALFVIAWMFVGFVFAINLFVGVVVDNFNRVQREERGSAVMTAEQQQWVDAMRAMARTRPVKNSRPPTSDGPFRDVRRRAYKLVTSHVFEGAVNYVIIANVALMACDHWRFEEQPLLHFFYGLAMLGFSVFYWFECAAKLIGIGATAYFRDSWCRFDFLLVVLSVMDVFMSSILEQFLPVPPYLIRVMRMLRIIRILRLLRSAKALRDLIMTTILSFPSLVNVGSLLALIIFMYSVLGVQLFTFLNHDQPFVGIHSGINELRNFATVGSSALLLFQCLTGDGWSGLMADAMIDESSGRCSYADGDCGSVVAVPYFISFQIIGSFVFLNLVVAVILENFSNLHNIDPDLVAASDIDVFREAWAEFDPEASNYIPSVLLPALLLKVPRPLGLKGKREAQAMRLCMRLKLPQHSGQLYYQEVLNELIENNYFHSGADHDEDDFLVAAPLPDVGELPSHPIFQSLNMQNYSRRWNLVRLWVLMNTTFKASKIAGHLPLRYYFALTVLGNRIAGAKAGIKARREARKLKQAMAGAPVPEPKTATIPPPLPTAPLEPTAPVALSEVEDPPLQVHVEPRKIDIAVSIETVAPAMEDGSTSVQAELSDIIMEQVAPAALAPPPPPPPPPSLLPPPLPPPPQEQPLPPPQEQPLPPLQEQPLPSPQEQPLPPPQQQPLPPPQQQLLPQQQLQQQQQLEPAMLHGAPLDAPPIYSKCQWDGAFGTSSNARSRGGHHVSYACCVGIVLQSAPANQQPQCSTCSSDDAQ